MTSTRQIVWRTALAVMVAVFGWVCLTGFAASDVRAAGRSEGANSTGKTDNPSQHVDFLLAQELNLLSTSTGSQGLAPSIDDDAFLRRASLDLIGQLPTPTEVAMFSLDPAKDKRDGLVELLLSNERYGRNWGRYWRDVILYRRSEDRALISSRVAEEFFTNAFNNNVGWDEITQSIITASGDVSEAGNIILMIAQQADANDVASEVSRIFMGVQISCAQCHDHPTDRWKREQFHEFAAFFPRVSLRPKYSEGRVRSFEIVGRDFAGFRGPADQPGRGSLEHYMSDLKDPSSQGKLMTPVFFATGQKLATGATDADRRHSIAEWITSTQNGWFGKAFVNRMWAELVGEGFCGPIDDMGPDRHPSAPKTLDYLARQFASHGYDVKWLMRTIMATQAYQRESRPRRLPDQTPFLANCSYRLRSDQVYDNLEQAVGSSSLFASGGGPYGGGRFGGSPRSAFGQVFGYDPSDRRDEISGSIPQALVLMNGPQLNSVIDAHNSQTMLGKLIAEMPDNEQAIVELYVRCLAREPSKDELTVSLNHVRASSDRAAAFEDLHWALINRSEFLHRN